MSMESVFAALGGWVLLGETMSGREIIGCALVFLAVLMAQLPPLPQKISVQKDDVRLENQEKRK